MLRDRRVLACLLVGVVGVLVSRSTHSGHFFGWSAANGYVGLAPWLDRLLALVPLLAGVAAVVLTGRPFAGVLVALPAQGLSGLLLAADFFSLAGRESVELGLSVAVLALVLLPADAYAERLGRRQPLGAQEGLVAGLLVGAAYVAIGMLDVLSTLVAGTLSQIPVSSWVDSYLPPVLALAAVGLLAGAVVDRLAPAARPLIGE